MKLGERMLITEEDVGKKFKTRDENVVELLKFDNQCLHYPCKFSNDVWTSDKGTYWSDQTPARSEDIVERLEETSVEKAIVELGQKMLPKKYNQGKPMMNLVRPEFIKALAEGLTYGFTKYDENKADMPNYLKAEGFHYSDIYDSLQRHLNAFWSGENVDPESGIEHLALAAVNIMFLHTYENSKKGIDNRTILKDNQEEK